MSAVWRGNTKKALAGKIGKSLFRSRLIHALGVGFGRSTYAPCSRKCFSTRHFEGDSFGRRPDDGSMRNRLSVHLAAERGRFGELRAPSRRECQASLRPYLYR